MSECCSPDAAVEANYENPTKKFSKKGDCEVGGGAQSISSGRETDSESLRQEVTAITRFGEASA